MKFNNLFNFGRGKGEKDDGPQDPAKRASLLRMGNIAASAGAVMAVGMPESAEAGPAEDYKRARDRVEKSRIHNGVLRLDYYVPKTDEVVDIGRFNTEGHGEMIEEDGIVDVLDHQGFPNFSTFSKAYNDKFSHRPAEDQQRAVSDAQYVDEKLQSRQDIKKGDNAFKNVRKALQIWITNSLLTRPIGDKYTLTDKTFDTRAVRGLLKDLDIRELQFYPGEAEKLELLLKHLPKQAPVFQKGRLTLDVIKKTVPRYAFSTDSEVRGEKYTEYRVFIKHFFDDDASPLLKAFRNSPHGAFAKEVLDFFHGNPPYENKREEAQDFAYVDNDLNVEERVKKYGFDPGIFDSPTGG